MIELPLIRDIDIPPSPRHVATQACISVVNRHIPLETALTEQATFQALSRRDRAFARLITTTLFRRMGQIDGTLQSFLRHTPPVFVHMALRTACAQILFLNTPPHAAVDETISLLKANSSSRKFASMANAILRRVSEQGAERVKHIAPQENIPLWLRQDWTRHYGRSAMQKMALQLQQIPPLDITFKYPLTEAEQSHWQAQMGGFFLPNGSLRRPGIGDITQLPAYDQGLWWIQDTAASLPISLLNINWRGQRVLDVCAAPGGKSLQLVAAGAHVTALDKAEKRLDIMRENLIRTGLKAELIHTDALDYQAPRAKFDYVLLDAPCSATGTFRRHPDVLYSKQPKDMAFLTGLQATLLDKALTFLCKGGTLIYCTCSLQLEEGPIHMQNLRKTHPHIRHIPINPLHLQLTDSELPTGSDLQTLPHFWRDKGGMDGFFITYIQNLPGN